MHLKHPYGCRNPPISRRAESRDRGTNPWRRQKIIIMNSTSLVKRLKFPNCSSVSLQSPPTEPKHRHSFPVTALEAFNHQRHPQ
jgi:hypothetical protein